MTTKSNSHFITGLITGIVAALIFGIVLQMVKPSPKNPEILAELEGGKLTRQELKNRFAANFVPIENDEYALFSKGVSEWLEGQLIQKEAQALGLSVQDFYAKEIWTNVLISPQVVVDAYNKNAALYGGQPFEKIAPTLTQRLREMEFERLKQGYLAKLHSKYRVKIYLQKPSSYVQGLALPPGPAGAAAPDSQAAAKPQQVPPPAGGGVLPPSTATFDDLAGRPSVGPENAPITIVEFSDFHCPFCQRVEPTIDQVMKNYEGKVRKVWRHFPLAMHAGAERTHEASECAHEQGKFWVYQKKLFENPGGFRDDAALTGAAEQVGLDKQKFQACLSSGKFQSVVKSDMAKGSSSGVNGTPAFFINGRLVSGAQPYQNFSNLIESLLDPSKAAQLLAPAQAPAQPQQPPPPPVNAQFNDLDGRPSVGPKNAPITLVIFSDFHCPFCQRVEPTIDQIMKVYDGKIRKVWRHYPLPMHSGADRTHAASECANEQEKFWPYHSKLFQNMNASKDDASLIRFAEETGLNKKKFEACLASNKYKAVVDKDIAKGAEVGVRGTPAVFVNGQLVSGAQPFESFDGIIKSKLAEKK